MNAKTVGFSLVAILIIYSIPAFLAGLDIYQGTEPDLSSEWIIISIYFVLSLILVITNLAGLIKRKK